VFVSFPSFYLLYRRQKRFMSSLGSVNVGVLFPVGLFDEF